MKPFTVALLFGGRSAEHEIAIISAQSVVRHINPEHYRVVPIYITRSGRWYSEGIAAAILEMDIATLIRKSGTAAASRKLQEMALSSGQLPSDSISQALMLPFRSFTAVTAKTGEFRDFLTPSPFPIQAAG